METINLRIGYLSMFYNSTIRPFLEPIERIGEHLFFKLSLFLTGLPFAINFELFTTPSNYWQALAYLVLLDLASGILRSKMDGRSIIPKKLVQTPYKIVTYVIAVTAGTLLNNTFPVAFGWVQYLIYILLCWAETKSILINLKMFRLMEVLKEQIKERGLGDLTLSDIKTETDKKSRKDIEELQENG